MEEAWLMVLQPHSELVTREVIGHSEAEGIWRHPDTFLDRIK